MPLDQTTFIRALQYMLLRRVSSCRSRARVRLPWLWSLLLLVVLAVRCLQTRSLGIPSRGIFSHVDLESSTSHLFSNHFRSYDADADVSSAYQITSPTLVSSSHTVAVNLKDSGPRT